jgi:hypothetical protein
MFTPALRCVIAFALVAASFALPAGCGAPPAAHGAHAPAAAPLAAHSEPAAPGSADPGFAGEWDSTYGQMRLNRFGDRLAGTYAMAGETCTIEGRVEGRRFTFRYVEEAARGEGWFELAPDGAAFEGLWRPEGSEEWFAWAGTRTAEPALSFAGVWESTYGMLRLTLDGARASGTYTYGGLSTLEGVVDGDLLRATYVEPDGARGAALFRLSADGDAFDGVWAPDPDAALDLQDAGAARWSGTRVQPVPGRTWLVILEAHWEGALAEPEYSYGQMLRSFFTRLPEVQVRHRFFHDRADFLRFCGELGGLAEPVVLYVSSHGSAEGIGTADGLLDGASIGAALRGAGDLRLVHFGSCEVLAGDLPRALRAAAAPHPAFPISGFPVSVDWAGSALVDFTYLELVLGRGVAPAEAVGQVREMLTFARPPGEAPGPIPGTGLAILDVEG